MTRNIFSQFVALSALLTAGTAIAQDAEPNAAPAAEPNMTPMPPVPVKPWDQMTLEECRAAGKAQQGWVDTNCKEGARKAKPAKPKPEKKKVLLCPAPAQFSEDKKSCFCTNSANGFARVPARVVDAESQYDNIYVVKGVCTVTDDEVDTLWEELEELKKNGATKKDLEEFAKKIPPDATGDLAKLKQEIEDLKNSTCRKVDGAWVNCPDQDTFKWDVGAMGLVVVRKDVTDTFVLGGTIGFTKWFAPSGAVHVAGFVGNGWNEDDNWLATGAEVSLVLSGESREHRVHLGLQGIVEPNTDGSEASFVGPKAAYRYAQMPQGFSLELGIAIGAAQAVLRDEDGEYTGELSDWEASVVPQLKLEYQW